MELTRLLQESSQPAHSIGNPEDLLVTGIGNDSRLVKPGWLFAAVPGLRIDGKSFAQEALDRGAVALLTTQPLPLRYPIQLIVPDVRLALGEMLSAFYGHPSSKLTLIGVTGTNGKTTVTHYVHSILRAAGWRAGLIGTLGTSFEHLRRTGSHTTPDSPQLQSSLWEMTMLGAQACVMELSSHALALRRVAGCEFDAVGITNITHDHLDFHGSWSAYRDTKLSAYGLLRRRQTSFGVANMDDSNFRDMRATCISPLLAFSWNPGAEVTVRGLYRQGSRHELLLDLKGRSVHTTVNLPGNHNVSNALMAATVALGLGLDDSSISRGISSLRSLPGRFEVIEGQVYRGVVDFAHNPDGLLRLLHTARHHTRGRLILVFGCEGGKDPFKRPLMGQIAAEFADRTIVTSDNWFNEDPDDIFRMIIDGYRLRRRGGLNLIWERDIAIRTAVLDATPADLVVVAGRGPDPALHLGKECYHFDDATYLRQCIDEKEKAILSLTRLCR